MSVQDMLDDVPHRGEVGTPPVVRELARRLLENGTSPGLARRVLARIESRRSHADFTHPIDLAAREIGSAFPRVVLNARGQESTALAILGARGTGRSAVARKLALRMRAKQQAVAVLAVDQPGSSRPEWLATWFEEMGVHARVVTPGMPAPERSLRGARVVLVDGSGDLERDTRAIDELSRGIAAHLAWIRVGVLAADADADRLRDEARALRDVDVECVVITRLDLATAPAAAFEIAAESGLSIAFVCDGPRDELHLHRGGPELAADVFLTGEDRVSVVLEPRKAVRSAEPSDRAPILYVTGGKGGVGKTVLCVNLCAALARRNVRVLLVDLDLGAADADILLRHVDARGLIDVLSGGARIAECASATVHGFDFVPGVSGAREWAALDDETRGRLMRALREAARGYDLVVLDGSPGIGADVLALAAEADSVLLVTTPELTALTDAYGLLKALHERSEALDPEIPTPEVVVNRARDLSEAEHTAGRLRDVAQRFLARSPRWAGWLPESSTVTESCRERRPFGAASRATAAHACLDALAARFARPRRIAAGVAP